MEPAQPRLFLPQADKAFSSWPVPMRASEPVSDLASAHLAALEWLANGGPGQSINLGNGRGFSVADVVRTAEKVTGRPALAAGRRSVAYSPAL
jgi:UDP-glucose 4-epimerase